MKYELPDRIRNPQPIIGRATPALTYMLFRRLAARKAKEERRREFWQQLILRLRNWPMSLFASRKNSVKSYRHV